MSHASSTVRVDWLNDKRSEAIVTDYRGAIMRWIGFPPRITRVQLNGATGQWMFAMDHSNVPGWLNNIIKYRRRWDTIPFGEEDFAVSIVRAPPEGTYR